MDAYDLFPDEEDRSRQAVEDVLGHRDVDVIQAQADNQ